MDDKVVKLENTAFYLVKYSNTNEIKNTLVAYNT